VSATITVRAPRTEEVAEIVRLINEVSQGEFGLDDMTEDELRRWFEQPDFDTERDVFVAEHAGTHAAYADVSNEGNAFEQYWIDVRIPPDGSEAAGEAVLAAAERRAAEMASEGPDGAAGRLVAGAWSVNALGKSLLERAGYLLYRHSYRMVIDLDGEIPQPEYPRGIEVGGFAAGRERDVFEAVDEAFRDSWDHVPGVFEEWRHWAIDRDDFDPSLWWLALDRDTIAGFCLCRPHETETDMGWVSSLGVRRPWRRRGIARALLLTSFHEFGRRGFVRVGLGVDAESQTGANLLYEGAGMRPVRRYDLYEKQLA
jgi:ribosomal protein S18 acetylase RimI-like enzyme